MKNSSFSLYLLFSNLKDYHIHHDVKSLNILLDDNWAAKISDFGVAKICATDQPYTHVNTEVKSSLGYFDPFYFMTRKLTRKSDVYAFGVILFEVLSGRPAVDLTLEEDQQSLSRWAQHCITKGMSVQIIERNLRGQIAPDCLMTFVQIADQCLENLPSKRPTMAEVVVKLESALALQERSNHDVITKSGDACSENFSMMSGRMTFSRTLRHFFSVKIRLSSGTPNHSSISIQMCLCACKFFVFLISENDQIFVLSPLLDIMQFQLTVSMTTLLQSGGCNI